MRSTIISLKRDKSDAPFDIHIEGTQPSTYGGSYKFSAHLVIWAIRSLVNYCRPEVAELTDYPDLRVETGQPSATVAGKPSRKSSTGSSCARCLC